jgi:segregation and condensation protein B
MMQEAVEEIEVEISEAAPAETEGAQAREPDHLGRLARIIESVLFAAGSPVGLKKLIEILAVSGARPSAREVQAALVLLRSQYEPGQRGVLLHEVAGGYQFRTAREHAEWVRAIFRDKPARLGRAALETLAIVAYKQPATRAEIEAIRGVDVDGVLTTLLGRKLIKIAGRKEAVGRPLLYATTPEFLETFGLKGLDELPSLKELGPAPDSEDVESAIAAENAPPATDAGEGGNEAPVATGERGALTEVAEPSRDQLAAEGGGADPDRACAGERPSGDDPGDEGGSPPRPDHG